MVNSHASEIEAIRDEVACACRKVKILVTTGTGGGGGLTEHIHYLLEAPITKYKYFSSEIFWNTH